MKSIEKNHQPNVQPDCCGNEHSHNEDDGHNHGGETESWLSHWPLILALAILALTQVMHFGFQVTFGLTVNLIVFGIALLLAGYNVFNLAWRKAIQFDFFNEFF
ncbi:MAG: heavy metal translocating P-type ATPase, partial [Pedobacter sp.]|nr:heavy metal translocating P-type ATPase [Pedobacter sp.]